jgi:hypothetical protein
MFFVILFFKYSVEESVVKMIFKVAGYTYGPLLGLFAFGILIKNRIVQDKLVPFICLISPAICYLISENCGFDPKTNLPKFIGYNFAEELIVLNALITVVGLLIISKKRINTDL